VQWSKEEKRTGDTVGQSFWTCYKDGETLAREGKLGTSEKGSNQLRNSEEGGPVGKITRGTAAARNGVTSYADRIKVGSRNTQSGSAERGGNRRLISLNKKKT